MSPLRAGAQKTPSHDTRSSDTPLSEVSPARCRGSAASHMLHHRWLGLCVTFVPSSEEQQSSLGCLQSPASGMCVWTQISWPHLHGAGCPLGEHALPSASADSGTKGSRISPQTPKRHTAKHTGQGRLMLSPRRVARVIRPCSYRIPVGLDVPTMGG